MTELSRILEKRIVVNWSEGTDADTSDYWEVTNDVLNGTFSTTWGRDQARSTAPARVETMEFVLNNQDGKYNNGAGPLAGFVNRGPSTAAALYHNSDIHVDMIDTIDLDGEDWTLDDPEFVTIFFGYVDQAPQTLAAIKSVAISSLGHFEFFVSKRVTLPLMENTRVDLILHAICDQLGIPANFRDFDTGDAIIDYFWMDDELPINIFPKLMITEGPGSFLYADVIDEQVVIHFQGRQYRINNYRSNTVQWYLYDMIVDPVTVPFRNPIYHNPVTVFNQNPDEVWNNVTATTNVRELTTPAGQKWNYGQVLTLGADEIKTLWTSLNNPVKNAIPPVDTVDYLVSSGAVTAVLLSNTSGTHIGITITAGPAGAVITGPSGQESDGIYLRAQELVITTTPHVQSTVDVALSLARYRASSLAVDIWPEINSNIAQDIVNAIATRYREPRDQLTLTVHNSNVDAALFIMRSRISDRIHVVVTAQGLDHDYFIESKTVQILNGQLVSCTLGCELVAEDEAFRFGIDEFGNDFFG